MKLKIIAFGVAKDILGASTIVVDVPENMSVANLKTLLEQQYPRLKVLHSYMVAIDHKYAIDTEILNTNNEIALIPPVSGG